MPQRKCLSTETAEERVTANYKKEGVGSPMYVAYQRIVLQERLSYS